MEIGEHDIETEMYKHGNSSDHYMAELACLTSSRYHKTGASGSFTQVIYNPGGDSIAHIRGGESN